MLKVDKLRVHNFRGIKDFEFELSEKTFVVAGRNGTGKSGVIDALEFAFTGSIGRLTGRGTGNVSVKSHAPHVDFIDTPKMSWVEVDFVLKPSGARHTLRRSVGTAGAFTLKPESSEARTAVTWMRKHPEFALTRREIVRFVLGEGKSRSDDVAQLLGLERIGNMRALLQRVCNSDKRDHDREQASLQSISAALTVAARTASPDAAAVLESINADRSALGLGASSDLGEKQILSGLDAPQGAAGNLSNRSLWLSQLAALVAELGKEGAAVLPVALSAVIDSASEKAADVAFLTAMNSDALLASALLLFDGGNCPVCGTRWAPGEFESVVAHKKAESKQALNDLSTLRQEATVQLDTVRGIQRALGPVVQIAAAMSLDDLGLDGIQAQMANAINALHSVASAEDLACIAKLETLSVTSIVSRAERVRPAIEALPVPSEADERRARLRAVSQRVTELEQQHGVVVKAAEKARISRAAFTSFDSSTANSLLEIYVAVEKTFAKFYAAINSDDEAEFEASLERSGAGLDMNVSFYGRGLFPPAAYHSEGHQDAMGLCLYLALASHTLGANFTLSALDDVLMSIDSGHRRFVVTLLLQEFPDTQFIITTHDDQWMRQIKTQGLARSREIIQFRAWDVASGPVSWRNYAPWDDITAHLEEGDVKAAAGALRSYLEYLSREIADNLHAPVPYRLDGQNTLGELFDSAVKTLRELLKKGKGAANSWNQQTRVLELSEWEEAVRGAALQAKQEEWAINVVVHFNAWENLNRTEFAQVVSAWKALLERFECPQCGGLVSVLLADNVKKTLACLCGVTMVNLQAKP
ncbi:hypothetical protein B7495_17125 [Cryobacterium sp. LW097]|uniref:AAA family ATPase n=1 Tax=Cryobacterium sp. LW097 TaxID=1978566 RepID=UPI000B4C8AAB|nr:AAA family ATPase [Cryobacterium sp. LW097]ASD23632.1 hypothetical protein B7495_17125 [Cryobacterium sp. LW097]